MPEEEKKPEYEPKHAKPPADNPTEPLPKIMPWDR